MILLLIEFIFTIIVCSFVNLTHFFNKLSHESLCFDYLLNKKKRIIENAAKILKHFQTYIL